MKSMNFGTMPSKKDFHAAWRKHMNEGQSYPYTLRGEDAEACRLARVPTSGAFGETKLSTRS